jgi:hypothetical protein
MTLGQFWKADLGNFSRAPKGTAGLLDLFRQTARSPVALNAQGTRHYKRVLRVGASSRRLFQRAWVPYSAKARR